MRGFILALETSGPTARVALVDEAGRCLAEDQQTAARHGTVLLPLCDRLFRAAGVTPKDLGAIACGRGPGSFTGLRVGMAVAKGLALPFHTPLVLVSSLAALASDLAVLSPAGSRLVACIDAGKGEVHAQTFAGGTTTPIALTGELRLSPDALAAPLTAGAFFIGGTGLDRHRAAFEKFCAAESLGPLDPGPTARAVARLALPRLESGDIDDLATAVPSYGRPPDITKPRPRES